MKRLGNWLKKIEEILDQIIMFLVVVLFILLILISRNPQNPKLVFVGLGVGGLINIINGLKLFKDKKKKSMGYTFVFLGAFIIVMGVLILNGNISY